MLKHFEIENRIKIIESEQIGVKRLHENFHSIINNFNVFVDWGDVYMKNDNFHITSYGNNRWNIIDLKNHIKMMNITKDDVLNIVE